MLLPGETATPGVAPGKSGTPTAQTAGTAFTVKVNAVDAGWNPVSTVTDTVGITSSDATAMLPANAALINGTNSFSVTLKDAGSQTVTANDLTDGTTTGTSSAVTVNAAPFSRLQVLMPGETAAPGTTTGKTGTPNAQTAGASYTVTVNAVDANWNLDQHQRYRGHHLQRRQRHVAGQRSAGRRNQDFQCDQQDRGQLDGDGIGHDARRHHRQHQRVGHGQCRCVHQAAVADAG